MMLSLHVFVRSRELHFARWNEFDLKRGIWEIPDTRTPLDGVPFSIRGTKMAGDIHVVPLSPQAVALLEQIHAITGKFELVFAGDAPGGHQWFPKGDSHPAARPVTTHVMDALYTYSARAPDTPYLAAMQQPIRLAEYCANLCPSLSSGKRRALLPLLQP
ncbi:Integrase [Pseudomonas sp. NGC7]